MFEPLPIDEMPCHEALDWLRAHGLRALGRGHLYTDGLRLVIRVAVPGGGCLLLPFRN